MPPPLMSHKSKKGVSTAATNISTVNLQKLLGPELQSPTGVISKLHSPTTQPPVHPEDNDTQFGANSFLKKQYNLSSPKAF